MAFVNPYAGAPFQTQLILHGVGVLSLWLVVNYMPKVEAWVAGFINPEAFYFKAAFYATLYLLAVILLPTLGVEVYKKTQGG